MKKLIKNVDGFDIYFEALEDDNVDFAGWDEQCAQDTKRDLSRGNLVQFCAHVTAEKAGIELGSDYLGSCIYPSEEDFYTTKGDYFDDMVKCAVDEAKAALPFLIEQLSA